MASLMQPPSVPMHHRQQKQHSPAASETRHTHSPTITTVSMHEAPINSAEEDNSGRKPTYEELLIQIRSLKSKYCHLTNEVQCLRKENNALLVDNRSLTETVGVSLEFKRMVDHMFASSRNQQAIVLEPYRAHYNGKTLLFRSYRRAFSIPLAKSIDKLDSPQFTDCGIPQCPFKTCNLDHIVTMNGEDELNTKQQNHINQNLANGGGGQAVSKSHDNQPRDPRLNFNNKRSVDEQSSTAAVDGSSHCGGNEPLATEAEETQQRPPGLPPTKRVKPFMKSESTGPATAAPARPIAGPRVGTGARSTGLNADRNVVLNPGIRIKDEPTDNNEQQISLPAENVRIPIEPSNNGNHIACKVGDCQRTFKFPSEANEHYKGHSKLFKCSVCMMLFSNKSAVFRHFVVHNDDTEEGQEKQTDQDQQDKGVAGEAPTANKEAPKVTVKTEF